MRRKTPLHAAHAFLDRRPRGAERLRERVDGRPRAWRVAAREEVHGGLAALGPRVDREVRLGDHDDAADALRTQPVDVDPEDLRTHRPHGVHEERLDENGIVERRERRSGDVEKEMHAERSHRIPSAPTAPSFAGLTFQRNASHT